LPSCRSRLHPFTCTSSGKSPVLLVPTFGHFSASSRYCHSIARARRLQLHVYARLGAGHAESADGLSAAWCSRLHPIPCTSSGALLSSAWCAGYLWFPCLADSPSWASQRAVHVLHSSREKVTPATVQTSRFHFLAAHERIIVCAAGGCACGSAGDSSKPHNPRHLGPAHLLWQQAPDRASRSPSPAASRAW
jgi:hypothetical protein